MKLDKKHKKGFLNHLRAIEWLTAQEYYVFDNISGLGPCDLIALGEDGEVIKIEKWGLRSFAYKINKI